MAPVDTPKWMVGTAAGDGAEDLPRVREGELAIVVRVERAHPRVEHLHGVHAGVDLGDEIVGDEGRQLVGEAGARRRGSPYIRLLVSAKLFEWPPSMAYDARVNGAPAKPISGTRIAELALDLADRVEA